MTSGRRQFLKTGIAAAVPLLAHDAHRVIPVALVQFDAVPEQLERNTTEVERLTAKAVASGARWVMFHEGTLCDYTPRLKELAEPVPQGKSVRRIEDLARRLKCFISYGLSENDNGRFYIAQVFTGPEGFIYRYRKTWIWHDRTDAGYRDEWKRYEPGIGPELFTIDGVRASCFICSDGESKRCLMRIADLTPEVVFHPNNRANFPHYEEYGERARTLGAPMLVTNRTGLSWMKKTPGASAVFSSSGEVLARANAEGREEILHHKLQLGRD
jgi:predicted amidohydrolase